MCFSRNLLCSGGAQPPTRTAGSVARPQPAGVSRPGCPPGIARRLVPAPPLGKRESTLLRGMLRNRDLWSFQRAAGWDRPTDRGQDPARRLRRCHRRARAELAGPASWSLAPGDADAGPGGAGEGAGGCASRHAATIASSSTSGTKMGGPTGIRRHSLIRWLSSATASRTSCSDRRACTVSASLAASLRSFSGVGRSTSVETPSRREVVAQPGLAVVRLAAARQRLAGAGQVVEGATLGRLADLLVNPRGEGHPRGLAFRHAPALSRSFTVRLLSGYPRRLQPDLTGVATGPEGQNADNWLWPVLAGAGLASARLAGIGLAGAGLAGASDKPGKPTGVGTP